MSDESKDSYRRHFKKIQNLYHNIIFLLIYIYTTNQTNTKTLTMANSLDQSSFISDSPDSGIDYETLSQHKYIQHHNNDWYQYDQDNNKSTVGKEQEQAILEDEEFNRLGYCKFENPLSEPVVRLSLRKVKITGIQLMNMSVKELNKRLSHCPPFIVAKLKKCRRTLKNRGYAKNCRIKRIAMKNRLEEINKNLLSENRELRQQNKSLTDQLNNLLASCNSNSDQNIIATNHNQQKEVIGINSNNFNHSNGQQQLISTPYGITPTTSIVNDYNQTYPVATMTTSTITTNVNGETSYYPLESELDYLAEQLALD